MSIKNKIRNYLGTKKLKAFSNQFYLRNALVSDLNSVRSLGIVYKLESETQQNIVFQFTRHLKGEYGIREINALGYAPTKELPEFAKASLGFDFFCEKDLSNRATSEKAEVKNFINKPFDALIDLTLESNLPILLVMAQSKAKYRVGKVETNWKIYDVMVDLEGSKDLNQLVKKIEYIMNIIKRVA